MRKLWKRFKNWLVIKLGGIDRDTYEDVSQRMINLDIQLQKSRKNLIELAKEQGPHEHTKCVEIRKVILNSKPVSVMYEMPYELMSDNRYIENLHKTMARELGSELAKIGALEYRYCCEPSYGDRVKLKCTVRILDEKR